MMTDLMEPDLFTVVRRVPGARDPLGNSTEDPSATTVYDGVLEQLQTVEGDTFVVNRYRAFFPGQADVQADDEVQARGQRYTVEGTPVLNRVYGFPALDHVSAVLQYVGPVVTP